MTICRYRNVAYMTCLRVEFWARGFQTQGLSGFLNRVDRFAHVERTLSVDFGNVFIASIFILPPMLESNFPVVCIVDTT
jgi:hypothetical protein